MIDCITFIVIYIPISQIINNKYQEGRTDSGGGGGDVSEPGDLQRCRSPGQRLEHAAVAVADQIDSDVDTAVSQRHREAVRIELFDDETKARALDAWNEALELYYARHFAEAGRAFHALDNSFDGDVALRSFEARARKLARQPPAEDWCGIETMLEK